MFARSCNQPPPQNENTESILESTRDSLEVSHPSRSRGLSSLCLCTPIVLISFEVILGVHFRILAEGYPQFAQVCFWMCNERLPHRRHN